MCLLNDAIKASRQGRADCQTNVITLLQRTLTSWEIDLPCIPTAAVRWDVPLCKETVITSSGLISVSSTRTSSIYTGKRGKTGGGGSSAYKIKIYIFMKGLFIFPIWTQCFS